MNLSVRKARMGDIRAIHALLMTSSADGLLLPRSLTDLYGHLRDCARWLWPPMRAGRDAVG